MGIDGLEEQINQYIGTYCGKNAITGIDTPEDGVFSIDFEGEPEDMPENMVELLKHIERCFAKTGIALVIGDSNKPENFGGTVYPNEKYFLGYLDTAVYSIECKRIDTEDGRGREFEKKAVMQVLPEQRGGYIAGYTAREFLGVIAMCITKVVKDEPAS